MSTSFFPLWMSTTAAQGYLPVADSAEPPIAGYTHHESDFSLQAPQRVLSLQLQDKVLLLTLQERPSCKTGYEIIYYVRTMNICIIIVHWQYWWEKRTCVAMITIIYHRFIFSWFCSFTMLTSFITKWYSFILNCLCFVFHVFLQDHVLSQLSMMESQGSCEQFLQK